MNEPCIVTKCPYCQNQTCQFNPDFDVDFFCLAEFDEIEIYEPYEAM